jgi:hypothetical protein
MLARLANVIYWTTNALVLVLVPYFVWGWYVGPERERSGVVLVGIIVVPASGWSAARYDTCWQGNRP